MPRAGSRILFGALGLAAVGLAVAGVWVPGLPATPFVILALWAFSRSSARLAAWLRRVPLLRSAVAAADEYRRERTLPRGVKIVAQTAAWGSAGLVALTTHSPWMAGALACAAVACSAFMLRTPTRAAGAPRAADGPVRSD